MHKQMEYVGQIRELQGMTAKVRDVQDHDLKNILIHLDRKNAVMAQFDDRVTLFGKRMDIDWHPFVSSQFMDIGPKPVF